MVEKYKPTLEGTQYWNEEWDHETTSIEEDAQQQIMVLCGYNGKTGKEGMDIFEIVESFARPIISKSPKAIWTQQVFDYAMIHMGQLVEDLIDRGHLEIVE